MVALSAMLVTAPALLMQEVDAVHGWYEQLACHECKHSFNRWWGGTTKCGLCRLDFCKKHRPQAGHKCAAFHITMDRVTTNWRGNTVTKAQRIYPKSLVKKDFQVMDKPALDEFIQNQDTTQFKSSVVALFDKNYWRKMVSYDHANYRFMIDGDLRREGFSQLFFNQKHHAHYLPSTNKFGAVMLPLGITKEGENHYKLDLSTDGSITFTITANELFGKVRLYHNKQFDTNLLQIRNDITRNVSSCVFHDDEEPESNSVLYVAHALTLHAILYSPYVQGQETVVAKLLRSPEITGGRLAERISRIYPETKDLLDRIRLNVDSITLETEISVKCTELMLQFDPQDDEAVRDAHLAKFWSSGSLGGVAGSLGFSGTYPTLFGRVLNDDQWQMFIRKMKTVKPKNLPTFLKSFMDAVYKMFEVWLVDNLPADSPENAVQDLQNRLTEITNMQTNLPQLRARLTSKNISPDALVQRATELNATKNRLTTLKHTNDSQIKKLVLTEVVPHTYEEDAIVFKHIPTKDQDRAIVDQDSATVDQEPTSPQLNKELVKQFLEQEQDPIRCIFETYWQRKTQTFKPI